LTATDCDLHLHGPVTDPSYGQRVRPRGHILEQITTVLLRQAAHVQAADEDLDRRNRTFGLRVGDPACDRARPKSSTNLGLSPLVGLYSTIGLYSLIGLYPPRRHYHPDRDTGGGHIVGSRPERQGAERKQDADRPTRHDGQHRD